MTLSPDPLLTVRYLFQEYSAYCQRNGFVRDHEDYVRNVSELTQRGSVGSDYRGVNIDEKVNMALMLNMVLDDEPVKVLDETVGTVVASQGTIDDLYYVLKTVDVLKSNELDADEDVEAFSTLEILRSYNRHVIEVCAQLGYQPSYEIARIMALPRTVEEYSSVPGYKHARRYVDSIDARSKVLDSIRST